MLPRKLALTSSPRSDARCEDWLAGRLSVGLKDLLHEQARSHGQHHLRGLYLQVCVVRACREIQRRSRRDERREHLPRTPPLAGVRAGRGSRSCARTAAALYAAAAIGNGLGPCDRPREGALERRRYNANLRSERRCCVVVLGEESLIESLDSSATCGCSRQDSGALGDLSTGGPLRLKGAQALTATSATSVRRSCCRVWAMCHVSLLCRRTCYNAPCSHTFSGGAIA